MIELVKEEKLEHEVEEADMIKERISLAVVSIDEDLGAIMNPRVGHNHHSAAGKGHSSSPEFVGSEEHETPPPGSPTTSATEVTSGPTTC